MLTKDTADPDKNNQELFQNKMLLKGSYKRRRPKYVLTCISEQDKVH